VSPRAGLDKCGKSRPHRDSIPGPSSPFQVAIPTELPGHVILYNVHIINGTEGMSVKTEVMQLPCFFYNIYATSWTAAVVKTVFSTFSL